MTSIEDDRMPPQSCPVCNKTLDAASPAFDPDAKPKPGDVTVCIYCCQVLQFKDDFTLTALFGDDVPLEVRPEIARVQAAIRDMLAKHPERQERL